MGKKDGKPRGKTTAYAYFVQTCRDEMKKKNPSETVVFAEFSKKCGEKWKAMSAKDKKRFDDMASKDKTRYDKEMVGYTPTDGSGKRGKRTKDPNAPKRALSAFFCFCNEERAKVKAKFPSYTIGDIAKELGKRWEVCTDRAKYDAIAAQDKKRYEREIAAYKSGGAAGKKTAAKPAAKPAAKKSKKEESEEDDDDDDEDDEEDEDDDE
jgi:uncharacterized short protein YbdD (DUF466 family)